MPSVIVKVYPATANGSDVMDAEARRMTPKEADKFVPRTSERMVVPKPHLSYDKEIAGKQMQEYEKKVAAMAKTMVPIQLHHGKTGKEEGFYVVTGSLAGRIKVCCFNGQTREWSNREGYEWDGPHLTLGEAQDRQMDLAAKLAAKLPKNAKPEEPAKPAGKVGAV